MIEGAEPLTRRLVNGFGMGMINTAGVLSKRLIALSWIIHHRRWQKGYAASFTNTPSVSKRQFLCGGCVVVRPHSCLIY